MTFTLGEKYNESFKVTAAVHQGFVNLFNDNNPLHTSEEFAVAKGFRGKVMHGNILNGFLSYFIGECLPTKDVIIHSQEIKFRNAVFMDDNLHFTAEIIGFYESVNAVEFKYKFINEQNVTVAIGKIQIGVLK